MRGLNCIKRLQYNLIRHLILSQSLLTRQLRSWTETALSFNARSFCARARPCAVRPLGGAATSPVSLYERATQSRRIGSLWCAVHDTVGPKHHARTRA
ncbi:hypothetical protein Hanom_Chr08g00693171 [Helianthus anomalus]